MMIIQPYAIPGLIPRKKSAIFLRYIEKTVCDYLDIEVEKLHEKTRKREIVEARQIIFYLTKSKTGLSLCEVGRYYEQHHATVIHGRNMISNIIDVDANLRLKIEEIENKLI